MTAPSPPMPDQRALAEVTAAAQAEGEQIIARARHDAAALRERGLEEEQAHRENLAETTQRLEERQQRIAARAAALDEREAALRRHADDRKAVEAMLAELSEQRVEALQRQAGVTLVQAKDQALAAIEQELREDNERRLRAGETAMTADAERRARGAIAASIQRLDPPEVPDPAADPLHAASDDARQKLLARDGHTLRAIEAATGCELAIEDVPGAVPAISLAGFDPVKREIARTALTWLIRDGAMNPGKVEAIIQRAQRDVAASIERAGVIAATEAACKDLPDEVLKTLGRLRYRTSYGQNQLQHAIETSRIGAMLAFELGADVYILRRSALLHDLGKAIDRDTEGTHAMLGADICRRAGMPEAIVHCIAAHHEEIEPETFEARLTIVADAISGGRPGARRESLERYLARLAALEDVAHSFAGVERAFAIQAGRELRILVKPEQIDDVGAARLARAVSDTIQEKLEYPGQIRVTVVRETRAVDYAR
ncbi:MAG TPA: Rnase Y domain-containing protein [Dehalococcoidia bacterium]|nr:Rnase Y domain-containing protein [Dehalococcoidia bacterium]